jgi:hypothetical protein
MRMALKIVLVCILCAAIITGIVYMIKALF